MLLDQQEEKRDVCIYILYYIILYYITLYYIISYYIILHYIILYYIVLYYIILYYIIPIYTLKQGVTGVPVGSVTNEDTSPGPVKTYLRDCGDAPGRI